MVKASLQKFIRKYPYFFTREPSSVFYRTSDVNNRSIQRLYNDLFDVYQSFHLDKKILIWREQVKPYDYTIHFVANYDNLKNITIMEDDGNILKYNTFEEDEEVDNFSWDYNAKYIESGVEIITPYECSECGNIYFNEDLNEACSECGNDNYIPLDTYICTECGELYFKEKEDSIDYNCSKNNHINTLQKVDIFRCLKCGEVIFTEEFPIECTNCCDEDYTNEGVYPIRLIFEEGADDVEEVTVNIFDENNILMDTIIIKGIDNWKGYTDSLPIHDTDGNLKTYTPIVEEEYIQPVIEDYLKHPTNFIKDLTLPLSPNTIIVKLDNSDKEYSTRYYEEIPIINEDDFKIELSEIPTTQYRMIVETYDEYTIEKGYPENDYTLNEYNRALKNKNHSPNVYDHDYSLDEIGALNNIPRKEYNIITDPSLYPYTEPPYNNKLTEDDYHYMKRMLEYNIRMWEMNPVSLELWKIYGIESELINRERYLLKVFDENKHPFDEETGLVKCWTPLKWEHKDKFCEGKLDVLKEYFFVNTNTIHPVVNQNVEAYFSIRNSLGELVDEEYYIDIYKVHRDDDYVRITGNNLEQLESHYIGNEYYISSDLIDNPLNPKTTKYDLQSYSMDDYKMEEYLTTFRFMAYKLNGDLIGSTDIVLFLRNYYNSDIHVDNMANIDKDSRIIPNYIDLMDGSLKYPYLTIDDALLNVTGNDNVIGVNIRDEINKYYYMYIHPLTISQSVKIIGNDYYEGYDVETHEYTNWYVPRIVNNTPRKEFFNVLGGKNITLTLSNLRLLRGQISSYISLNEWYNTNKNITNNESVLIHGGVVLIETTFNQDTFYPYDNITATLQLTSTDGTILSDNNVIVKYNDNIIFDGDTDSEGMVEFDFTLDERKNGVYKIIVSNKSETYFEADVTVNINATKPITYESITYPIPQGETNTITLISTDNTPNSNVTFYCYDDSFEPYTDEADSEGNVEYVLTDINGEYLFYTTIDNVENSPVKDEYIVESNYLLNTLLNTTFIKNLILEDDGDLSYDTFSLSNNPTLEELNGVVVDVDLDEDDDLVVSTFKVDVPKYNDDYISYSDAVILENAITSIRFDDDTGDVSVNRLGKFWENE